MKTIAIVCGGDSSEHDVSMRSAEGIASFIDPARYIIYKVEIHAGKWEAMLPDGSRANVCKDDFSFVHEGTKVRPDFAYITIHGAPGENGELQGYFDLRAGFSVLVAVSPFRPGSVQVICRCTLTGTSA